MLDVLDTFIGLVTIYLILSLIVTAIGEGFSTQLNLRGGTLLKILSALLGEAEAFKFMQHPKFQALSLDQTHTIMMFYHRIQSLFGLRYVLPPVQGRYTVKAAKGTDNKDKEIIYRTPSYLDPDVFVDILLQRLVNPEAENGSSSTDIPVSNISIDRILSAPAGQKDAPHLAQLRQFWRECNYDQAVLRERLKDWFNTTADRSNGWFKRALGKYLFIIGCWVALFLNADTLHMFKVMTSDRATREQMVQTASQLANLLPATSSITTTLPEKINPAVRNAICNNANPELETCTDEQLAKSLLTDLLPVLGWDAVGPPLDKICFTPWEEHCQINPTQLFRQDNFFIALVLKIIGIVLTAAAISLGAPFWFDLLHKVIRIRGAIRSGVSDGAAKPPAPDSPTVVSAPVAKSRVASVSVADNARADLESFNEKCFGYDLVNHYWAARLSGMAYDSAEVSKQMLGELGGESTLVSHKDDKNDIDTQCLIARTGKAAFFSLRGTEKNLQDWLTDAKIEQVSPDQDIYHHAGNVLLHKGFHEALFLENPDCAWQKILDDPLTKEILEKGLPIWVSGHSLGGALAILLALRLDRHIKAGNSTSVIAAIQTFGQPRVGNQAFADMVEERFPQRYFRSVNHRDIVPRVPFPKMPAFWKKNKADQHSTILEYAHAGRVLYFNDLGQGIVDPPIWFRTLDRLTMNLEKDELKQELSQYAGDHSMDKYIALHDALLKSAG